ncbi:MAG: hypothetical protein J2P28_24310, partial [Actinobacteria bacterium]|nr:hypothetical protein [Actinomycetota bacterium]
MSAVRTAVGQAFRREDDDAPVAARTRRDWIVDSVLFLLAALLAVTSVMTVRDEPHGPMLAVDAAGAAIACVALWWRRRWPLAVGLAGAVIQVVSPAAALAGAVTLYSVAAYRRWQLASMVAVVQVALLPLAHAIRPQSASLAVYYLTGTLGSAVVVAWGMLRR